MMFSVLIVRRVLSKGSDGRGSKEQHDKLSNGEVNEDMHPGMGGGGNESLP